MKFVISDKYKKLLNLQVTQTKSNFDYLEEISKSEYDVIKDIIGQPQKILDLGCGLGRFSIYLNKMLKNEPLFVMADYSKISKKVKYGWNPDNSTYNSLEQTIGFCKENDLIKIQTFDLAERRISELSDIGLAYSFFSVGFHYPIEKYIADLIEITTDSAIIMFGIRKGQYSVEKFQEEYGDSFSEIFIRCNLVDDTKEEILVLQK